jgi:NADP-dependent 3-hydroxy acid dehydrogenase YdfG
MSTDPFSLQNKTILVTGASSGNVRGIVIACAEGGAKVLLLGRAQERLEEMQSLYAISNIHIPFLAGMVLDKNVGDDTVVFYRYKERVVALPKAT